jgi:hypothetical protein
MMLEEDARENRFVEHPVAYQYADLRVPQSNSARQGDQAQ